MAGVVNVQCILVAVMLLLLPALMQGSRPTLMAAEMQHNVSINKGKAGMLEILPSQRKLQEKSMENFQQQVRREKVKNAPPLMSGESARQVPTGPDPLHHNGGPIKPAFP